MVKRWRSSLAEFSKYRGQCVRQTEQKSLLQVQLEPQCSAKAKLMRIMSCNLPAFLSVCAYDDFQHCCRACARYACGLRDKVLGGLHCRNPRTDWMNQASARIPELHQAQCTVVWLMPSLIMACKRCIRQPSTGIDNSTLHSAA